MQIHKTVKIACMITICRMFIKLSESGLRASLKTKKINSNSICRHRSSCYCFVARGIVSVVCSIYSQRVASHSCETLRELRLHRPGNPADWHVILGCDETVPLTSLSCCHYTAADSRIQSKNKRKTVLRKVCSTRKLSGYS